MRVCLAFVAMLLLCVPLARSQDNLQLLNEAQEAYALGNYNSASRSFEKLLAAGQDNGHVHYNYANSLYRTGEYARALLHYRIAELLLPRDQDVKVNLKLTREHLATEKIDGRAAESAFDRLLLHVHRMLSPHEESMLTLCFYVLTWFFLLLYFMRRSAVTKLLFVGSGLMLAFFMGLSTFSRHDRLGRQVISYPYFEENLVPSIVLAKEAKLYTGSKNTYPVLATLPEGSEIAVSVPQLKWSRASLADGRHGWIQTADIGFVE